MQNRTREGKTPAIRATLVKNAGSGITAREIRQAVRGIVNSTYLYNVLPKMKRRREIRSSEGRYYLVKTIKPIPPSSEKLVSATNEQTASLQGIHLALDQELDRIQHGFDEYRRGHRDGWMAAKSRSSDALSLMT